MASISKFVLNKVPDFLNHLGDISSLSVTIPLQEAVLKMCTWKQKEKKLSSLFLLSFRVALTPEKFYICKERVVED